MSDLAGARKEADNPPCETPLLDLLRNVPTDARAVYEHHPTSHSLISYGSLCQRAADEIERLRSLLAATPEPAAAVPRTICYCTEHGEPHIHAPALSLSRGQMDALVAIPGVLVPTRSAPALPEEVREAAEIVRNIITAFDAHLTPRGTLTWSSPDGSTGFIAAIHWLERLAARGGRS